MYQASNVVVADKPLLDEYQVGDFFLASPQRTLLGKGSWARVPSQKEKENPWEGLTERVLALFEAAKGRGDTNPVIVGAVPFDDQQDVQLLIPETIKVATALPFAALTSLPSPPASAYEIKSLPEPERYIQGVAKGLDYIKTGRLRKIVLSRTLHLTSATPIDLRQLLYNLARQNACGYTFAVDLSAYVSGESGTNTPLAPGRTLIGASPELLVSRSGLHLTANPLAGSRPRSKDPATDQRLAAELLASAKDLHEHEVVASTVAAALRPYCKILDVPKTPSFSPQQ